MSSRMTMLIGSAPAEGLLPRSGPRGDVTPGGWFEGLWDCESDVRLIAAQRVPLDDKTRDRLRYLRDDPLETPAVRDAAATRLES